MNDIFDFYALPESFKTTRLAKFLNISKTSVYNLISSHALPCLKVERTIIIFKQQFIDWYNGVPIISLENLSVIQ